MFDSDEAAASALSESVDLDNDQSSQTSTDSIEVSSDEPTEGDNVDIMSLDPNSLAPELLGFYKKMQGDYTRKTQEIAPFRSLVRESGLDIEQARQALQFVQALRDPDSQRALYENLHGQFGNYPQQRESEDDYDWGDGPEEDSSSDYLRDMDSRIRAMEDRAARGEVRANIDRQEAYVRNDNPAWGDDDINSVAQLALSREGNLLEAAEDYKLMQNRILSDYISKKAQVPGGTMGLPVTGHAERPRKFESLDDAHNAALQLLVNDFNA